MTENVFPNSLSPIMKMRVSINGARQPRVLIWFTVEICFELGIKITGVFIFGANSESSVFKKTQKTTFNLRLAYN